MRRLSILGVAWTGVMLTALVYWPWSLPDAGCARRILRPPGCLAEIQQLNDAIWWTQTLPILALFACGYGTWCLLAIRRWRRSRR